MSNAEREITNGKQKNYGEGWKFTHHIFLEQNIQSNRNGNGENGESANISRREFELQVDIFPVRAPALNERITVNHLLLWFSNFSVLQWAVLSAHTEVLQNLSGSEPPTDISRVSVSQPTRPNKHTDLPNMNGAFFFDLFLRLICSFPLCSSLFSR